MDTDILPLKERLAQKKLALNNPVSEDDQPDHMCSICYEDAQSKNRGVLETCNHIFCFDCIVKWSKAGRNCCPMCNREFHVITAERTPTKTFKNGKKRKCKKVIHIKKNRSRRSISEDNFEDEVADYAHGGRHSYRQRSARRFAQQSDPATRPANAQAAAGIYNRRGVITSFLSYLDNDAEEDDPFMEWSQLTEVAGTVTQPELTTNATSNINPNVNSPRMEIEETRRRRRGMSIFNAATGGRQVDEPPSRRRRVIQQRNETETSHTRESNSLLATTEEINLTSDHITRQGMARNDLRPQPPRRTITSFFSYLSNEDEESDHFLLSAVSLQSPQSRRRIYSQNAEVIDLVSSDSDSDNESDVTLSPEVGVPTRQSVESEESRRESMVSLSDISADGDRSDIEDRQDDPIASLRERLRQRRLHGDARDPVFDVIAV